MTTVWPVTAITTSAAYEPTRQALNPEAVVAGFEKRVDAVFRAESGKPLVADKISKVLARIEPEKHQ